MSKKMIVFLAESHRRGPRPFACDSARIKLQVRFGGHVLATDTQMGQAPQCFRWPYDQDYSHQSGVPLFVR